MKKYALWLVMLSLIAVMGFLIVSTTFQPIDSLMRPPQVEGENLSIQLAFEEKVGTDYILKRPVKGNYRNAYTFIDLTGDKNNEVIVFYSKADNLEIVRMNVLRNIDGSWKSIGDFQSVHNDILEVEFADLNGDGNKEILVGWSAFLDNYSKLLSIYEVIEYTDSVRIRSVYSDYYSAFKVVDIDRDSIDDILSIKYASASGAAEYTAAFLTHGRKGISEKSSFSLDKSLNSIGAINCDFAVDNTKTRFFVDGYKVDSGMITDCFVWDNTINKFERCHVNGASISAISSRTSTVFCKDVNNDGLIEIPTEEFLPSISYDNLSKSYTLGMSIINWLKFDSMEFELLESHIILSQYGYSFRFKQSWFNNVSVENDTNRNMITFWKLKYIDGVAIKDKELFSIITLTDFDLEFISEIPFNYFLLGQAKDKYYYCRIYDEGYEYGITKKDIKNRIILG